MNCGIIKIYCGEQLDSTYDSNGNQIKYYEYDVNNRIQGMPRDGERFVRDDSGEVHTNENHNYLGSPDRLPTAEELKGYDTDELEFFRDELTESVKKRIEANIEHGYEKNHAQRQSAEQFLIKVIENILKDR